MISNSHIRMCITFIAHVTYIRVYRFHRTFNAYMGTHAQAHMYDS